MIETLILGFVLGVLSTGFGVLCAAYKQLTRKYSWYTTTDGCIVAIFDKTFENDKYHTLGIKNSKGDVIAGIKFDDTGIKGIVRDVKL